MVSTSNYGSGVSPSLTRSHKWMMLNWLQYLSTAYLNCEEENVPVYHWIQSCLWMRNYTSHSQLLKGDSFHSAAPMPVGTVVPNI